MPLALDLPAREALKARIARLERNSACASAWGVAPFGDARVDGCLPHGGLQRGHWHEIAGDGFEQEAPAAMTGFAALLARQVQEKGMIVWALRRDDLHAPGLQSFGIDPDRLILVRVDKDDDALAVQEDALRTRSVAVAIGETDRIDLTAGRRLQLACEKNGATGFVLRRKLYASKPRPGVQCAAAATRWRIAPAPSQTSEPGLGPPRWTVRLERCRGGRSGAWIMETQNAPDSTTSLIRVVAELADHAAVANDAGRAAAWARDRVADRKRAASGSG